MDDSELFDVFDVDNNPEPTPKDPAPPIERSKSHKKKSKRDPAEAHANGPSANGKRPHEDKQGKHTQEGTPPVKKPRKRAEDPIVVDSFETESDQIVPATTGLQGTVPADANIVIKKRVCPLCLDVPLRLFCGGIVERDGC
jgi:hypothetical protein